MPINDRFRQATTLLFMAAQLALSACGERPPNVVLLTLDTTRADFLGCYGKASARTPNLDRLAAEGYLFEHAYASNPVTQPSHSTILTGTYPMVHGVRDNGLFHLPDERQTLAELLKARGYATAAAIGGFPLTREFGTAQGFDFYDDDLKANQLDLRGRPARRQFASWYDERPAGHVNDAILPWLRQRQGEPFFIWLHYWDPHAPHTPPAPYNQLFAHDPYQGEIAYADDSLGTILRELAAIGEAERTLIVVTADHGEGHFEHNEATHAFLAYDATLHVPLILQVPSETARGNATAGTIAGRRLAERVGTVDIVPTILDLLGFQAPTTLHGRSLAPLMFGGSGAVGQNRRPYYSESLSPRLSHGFGELRVLFQGPYKYIHGPRPELFNLAEDPAELRDLSTDLPREREGLEARLRQFLDTHASPEAADAIHEASAETRRQLAALGYLSTANEAPGAVTETIRSDGIAPQDRVGDINLVSRLRQELSRGAFPLARHTAAILVKKAPDNAYYRAKLAVAHLGMGQTEEAAKLVTESQVITGANVDDFLSVARALFDHGERDRGLQMVQRLVAAEETAPGHWVLGQMHGELGENDAFEAAMTRALELQPDMAEAYLALAAHFTDQESFDRAEAELSKLFETSPAHPQALLVYGRLERARGKPQQALRHLERSLMLAPTFCETHLERLELHLELDQRKEAQAALTDLRRRCRNAEIRAQSAALLENG